MAKTATKRQETLADKYRAAGLSLLPVWVAASEKDKIRDMAHAMPETAAIRDQLNKERFNQK